MQSMSGSFRNLKDLETLASGDDGEQGNLVGGGPLGLSDNRTRASKNSVDSSSKPRFTPLRPSDPSYGHDKRFVLIFRHIASMHMVL